MEARKTSLGWTFKVEPEEVRGFLGCGLRILRMTATSKDVKIHLFPTSGSFVLEVTGLKGRIPDLATLKTLVEWTLQDLGWSWMRISNRKRLYTAFNEPDRECDLVIEGYSMDDRVPEGMKYDIGVKLLPDGQVQVYGISRSRPLYSSSFKKEAYMFADRLRANANVYAVIRALGVQPVSIQRSTSRTVVKIQVGVQA